MKSVYICHTFFHVYVTMLMELNKADEERGKATLLLSTMSNDFGELKDRAAALGVFKDIYMFDEKEDVYFPDVMKYHKDRGNIVLNLLQRIKYTRLLGQKQEAYIPVDLKAYDDVYVFCDSDPIGFYLNYKKIHYHSMEDGINSCKLDDQARNTNLGAFGLKCFMSKLGLIFIENGYARYCDDFIVNDISENLNPPKNIKEMSFLKLCEGLDEKDHEIMVEMFLGKADRLLMQLNAKQYEKPCVMLLTEPLCELPVRKKLFGDIIEKYQDDYTVIIKPHPRDLLDYEKEFPNSVVIKDRFPMEVMNDIKGLRVSKLISVITQVNGITFADKIEYLGLDFLDKYEDPSIHRKIGKGE